ncbi:hypothetical protein EVAR_68395_1 [Eumeta japonica]|uniref:Uncharacterized protein n=1 Tax=Eumeta variegata TaxID=151549 RepID=A0A4C2ACE3_EUMVA|nr:hypothetical protein EVAR_68395_1 [Eumeta japonica]
MPTSRHPLGNHAPTAFHADRPRQTKSTKLQFIGSTDNCQLICCFGGFVIRKSRTHPTHAGRTLHLARGLPPSDDGDLIITPDSAPRRTYNFDSTTNYQSNLGESNQSNPKRIIFECKQASEPLQNRWSPLPWTLAIPEDSIVEPLSVKKKKTGILSFVFGESPRARVVALLAARGAARGGRPRSQRHLVNYYDRRRFIAFEGSLQVVAHGSRRRPRPPDEKLMRARARARPPPDRAIDHAPLSSGGRALPIKIGNPASVSTFLIPEYGRVSMTIGTLAPSRRRDAGRRLGLFARQTGAPAQRLSGRARCSPPNS